MKPYLQFHQSVVDGENGYCFAIAMKWVGLMLEDAAEGSDYLERTTQRHDSAKQRSWKITKARMASSVEAGARDVASNASIGLPRVQCAVATPWIRRYANNQEASVEVFIEDVDSIDQMLGRMAGAKYEAFIISSSSPPHSVGVVFDDDGNVQWFDPNHGVYQLGGVDADWRSLARTVITTTAFAPDWVLGIRP